MQKHESDHFAFTHFSSVLAKCPPLAVEYKNIDKKLSIFLAYLTLRVPLKTSAHLAHFILILEKKTIIYYELFLGIDLGNIEMLKLNKDGVKESLGIYHLK